MSPRFGRLRNMGSSKSNLYPTRRVRPDQLSSNQAIMFVLLLPSHFLSETEKCLQWRRYVITTTKDIRGMDIAPSGSGKDLKKASRSLKIISVLSGMPIIPRMLFCSVSAANPPILQPVFHSSIFVTCHFSPGVKSSKDRLRLTPSFRPDHHGRCDFLVRFAA